MEDKFIQSGEIEKYISIGKTKITEIIKSGNFVKPIFINGFSLNLNSFFICLKKSSALSFLQE